MLREPAGLQVHRAWIYWPWDKGGGESLHVLSIVKKEEVEQSVPSQKDSAELGKRHSLTKSWIWIETSDVHHRGSVDAGAEEQKRRFLLTYFPRFVSPCANSVLGHRSSAWGFFGFFSQLKWGCREQVTAFLFCLEHRIYAVTHILSLGATSQLVSRKCICQTHLLTFLSKLHKMLTSPF